MASSPPPDAEGFFKYLMESMVCPVCKDQFKKPKVTNCGHTFCQECLQEYINRHQDNYPPCPLCRNSILPLAKDRAEAAASFPTQSLYEDIINRTKTEYEEGQLRQCDLCMKFTKLETRCLSCAYNMCATCTSAHSKLNPLCTTIQFSETENVPEAKLLAEENSACVNHKTDRSVVFCYTCQKHICERCRIGEHLLHKIVDQKKFADSCRNKMQNMLINLTKFKEQTLNAFADLELIETRFKDNADVEQENVNSTFDEAIAALERKRREILKALSKKRWNIESRFDKQREKYENIKRTIEETEQKFKMLLRGAVQGLHESIPQSRKELNDIRRTMHSLLDAGFGISIKINPADIRPVTDVVDDITYEITTSQNLCNQCKTRDGFLSTGLNENHRYYLSHFSDGNNFIVSLNHKNSMFNWSNILLCVQDDKVSMREMYNSKLWTTTYIEAKPSWRKGSLLFRGVGRSEFLELNYTFDVIDTNEFELPTVAYSIFPVDDQYLAFFDAWRQKIACTNRRGEVKFEIDNEHTKIRPIHMFVSNSQRILLLGENFCRVFNFDGEMVTDVDMSRFVKQDHCTASCGCLDHHDNIITRIEVRKDKTRSLWKFSPDGEGECLCLPALPSGHTLEVSSACEAVDSSLFVCADKVTKVLRVGYLP